jgi:fatty-acyl-CoA synthase
VLTDANYVPLSPVSFLRRARRAFGGKVAVVDGDGTEVSYESLAADCDAMAGALRGGGIRPGERVAILDLNIRWLLAAHFCIPGSCCCRRPWWRCSASPAPPSCPSSTS